ncbi:S8 family serine peptidase [Pseudomonas sp. LS44]|uniref:S8 family serine peptidase n=1 Tax=Pseudomonas sp. LS44 TaxID=1357074 RepID=UPI00215A476E|nr:S8 family serine peptidase [Pseudomonas sp. LS44]UVE19162.1 S8 family serine peptidase [Pseudomonas sp. LS44]
MESGDYSLIVNGSLIPLMLIENIRLITPVRGEHPATVAARLARSTRLALDRAFPPEFLVVWGDKEKLKEVGNYRDIQNTRSAYQDSQGNLLVLTNEILISFDDESSDGDRKKLIKKFDGKVIEKTATFWKIYVTEPNEDAPLVLSREISNERIVKFAEPNFLQAAKFNQLPQDEPRFGDQWHLRNTGQRSGTPGADVSALGAWTLTTGSPDIGIAIIDSGIDTTHPDLFLNIAAGWNFDTNDDDPSNKFDAHGTACAGIIAAAINGLGVVGIAPNCQIIPIKLTDFRLVDTWASAFDWAALRGRIISCSFTMIPSNTVTAAITRAVSNGVSVFCSTGNFHTPSIGYPASLPETIAVGASDHRDTASFFSRYGNGLDILAPGGDLTTSILTTDIQGVNGFSKQNSPEGDYCSFSGTSAAAPLAAGIAGLMLSVNPTLTPENIRTILNATAEKIDPASAHYDANGWSFFFGFGRVNASKAVHRAVRFSSFLSVFPTNPSGNKKSIYTLTTTGRLIQIWDTNQWNLDFPAELAGHTNLRFRGGIAVFPTGADVHKKSIFAITVDKRLAQIWDTDQWHLHFPAELAGNLDLRFQGSIAVFPTNASGNKKSIYAITSDGRLAQIWDTNQWNLDFPAELAGFADLRFQGGIAVFPSDVRANKKSIYAITTDGRLAQIWDTNQWNLDFPAERSGFADLKFQGSIAVFPTDAGSNKKSIYAITTDGQLAQIWDTNQWNLDFPAILASRADLRFQGGIAVFPIIAGANKKSIFVITTDGRLAQLWDTNQWNLDFPAERSGFADLKFQGDVAVFPINASANEKSIYVVTTDGRLTQIADTNQWSLDFPVELV